MRDPSAPIAIQSVDEWLSEMTVLSPSLILADGALSFVRMERRGDEWDISPYPATSYDAPVVAGGGLLLRTSVMVANERRTQLQIVSVEDGSPIARIVLPPDALLLDYDALPDGRFVLTTGDGLVALFDPANPEGSLLVYYSDYVLAGVRAGPENEILFSVPVDDPDQVPNLFSISAVIERWTVDELEAKAEEYGEQGCAGWSRQGDLLILEAHCQGDE